MSREEFERGLHAAPTMVKGRGMNHHLNLIWNTVDAYVTKNHALLKQEKAWLIQWRDFNCPHARVEGLLKQRIEELEKDFTGRKTTQTHETTQTNALTILQAIKAQSINGVSGKRLLLEAAVRTAEMGLNQPLDKDLARYDDLAKKLAIEYPTLKVLCGLMKSFLGALLFLPSLGKSKGLIESGWSTVKAGLQSEERKTIQEGMRSQLTALRQTAETKKQTPQDAEEANQTPDPKPSP